MKSYSEAENTLLFTTPNGYKLIGYHHTEMTLLNFLEVFFSTLNKIYATHTNNPVINYLVCEPNKKRSLGDIFLICRHYYPDCTLKEVHNLLISMPLISFICDTKSSHNYLNESKRIFAESKGYACFINIDITDEFGWTLLDDIND
jgi:hypothetical protein